VIALAGLIDCVWRAAMNKTCPWPLCVNHRRSPCGSTTISRMPRLSAATTAVAWV